MTLKLECRVDVLVEQWRNEAYCTYVNQEGYECGRVAVLQLLPDGDQARCLGHIKQGEQ